ncbi:MAG: hypothetical protein MI924_36870 [Chloroflexales bacterium]|nr:hypothetical protein [Chloroflexales bacterium]
MLWLIWLALMLIIATAPVLVMVFENYLRTHARTESGESPSDLLGLDRGDPVT